MHTARWLALGAAALSLSATSLAAASCGSAFCLVNTNWSTQGVWNEPGARFDLRYEYIDQDQLRSGSDRVAVGEIARHHDELRTLNRNIVGTLDYGFTPDWGLSVSLPWVDRRHDHIHNHRGEAIPESWSFSELGDVRVVGRFQRAVAADEERARFAGLTLGLKLPTGRRDVANGDGDVAERSLQPGTGTTDALLGGYYRVALPLRGWSWFVQGNLQFALNERDGFRPGPQAGVDVGYRYDATQRVALMLQLNASVKGRDRGSEAEPEDSGSHSLSLSPGLSVSLAPGVQAYAFAQLPLLQHVNGVQLTARRSLAGGVSVQF